MSERRKITANDVYAFVNVSDPQFSLDGTAITYTRTSIDEETKEYRSRIEWSDLRTGEARSFTSGPKSDSYSRWSPDGKRLAFVSDRSGTKQIWTMNTDGGEAVQLTFLKNGASNPTWSPDGQKIIFTSSLRPDEAVEKESKEKKDEQKDEPLVVDRMRYKSDDSGFWNGSYNHVFVVPSAGGEVKQLTNGESNAHSLFWTADSERVGFVSYRGENADHVFLNDIYLVSVNGGEPHRLTQTTLQISQPSVSPDGRTLAFFASDMKLMNASFTRIYTLPIEGGEPQCVTAEFDQYIGDAGMSDLRAGSPTPSPQWSADGQAVYCLSAHDGNVHLYRISLNGEILQCSQGQRQVFGFAVHPATQQAVLAVTDPVTPNDLFLLQLATGEEKRLTQSNEALLTELSLSEPEEFWCEGVDGWQLQGWVMRPIGFEEGQRYPMAFEIHGGPHAMYSNSFFHEFQLLAARGYVVVYSNPRGSIGYGQEFVNACRGDYGGKDYGDLMKVVDFAVESFPFVDADRMVVTGGSYGGFMTNWIVGQDHRFKAAVTQRSISNWLSFYGVSDIGYYFTEWQIDGNAWDDVEKLWNHSPIKYVANIETPLLILHSEHDYRCPIEQAEQLFIAMKRIGKADTQFVRFPNANHNLSRNGKPKLRVERLERITGWFDKYIHAE